MNRRERWEFFAAYWPGLCLLVFVYVALTVIRTLRDDFGVEIWRDLGVSEEPSVFARSEFCVAVAVTGLNATVIAITNNLRAIRWTLVAMCLSFAGVALSGWAVSHDLLSPFGFMVLCGVGLYIPYVAFHTTVFERLIAASKRPGNLGFLMYVADAMGYLGYTAILVGQTTLQEPANVLPIFQRLLIGLSLASVVAIFVSMLYLQSKLSVEAISVDLDPPSEHASEQGES